MVDTKDHFAKHQKKYKEVIERGNKYLYKNIREELDKNLQGVVLDIGNGGVFNYNTKKLKKIIAVDLVFKSLKGLKDTNKIRYIAGDARNLKKIKKNSCNSVVMQFLLHHITDADIKKTYKGIEKSLKESQRVLKKKGELLIIEMVVGPFFEKLENAFYNLNSFLFSLINKPMITFYSKDSLCGLLKKAGFRKIYTKHIYVGKYLQPCGGICPHFIKIPSIFYPMNCYMIKGVK